MSAGRGLALSLTRGTRAWAPSRVRMSSWATRALGRRGAGREIAVRVVTERESHLLNKRWRGKDSSTNVLSFPAPASVAAKATRRGPAPDEALPLGDLVICAEVVRREAARDDKNLDAHWAHMVVHGALHLAGYDHELGRRERLRMERREIAVLKSFGFGNPYT
jgi:probable rRNA maturation factor